MKKYIKGIITEIIKEDGNLKVKIKGINHFLLNKKNYENIDSNTDISDKNIFITKEKNKSEFELVEVDFKFCVNESFVKLIYNIFNNNCAYIFVIECDEIVGVRKCD